MSKKRGSGIWTWILSVLALLMVGLLMPMEARADITISGGTEGTDYTFVHSYPLEVANEDMENNNNNWVEVADENGGQLGLNILTGTPLTISGSNKELEGLRKAIFIEKGITANLTINNLTMQSSTRSGCIVLREDSTLNLTIQGDCAFGQDIMEAVNTLVAGNPSIVVPEYATLNITKESTGTLTASSFRAPVIGCGQVPSNTPGTINIAGGKLKLTSIGGTSAETRGTVVIGGYKNCGSINISGGDLELETRVQSGETDAKYDIVTIGSSNQDDGMSGSVNISGGTIVSNTNGHRAGLGQASTVTDGVKVQISGGKILAAVGSRPVNEEGKKLYLAEISIKDQNGNPLAVGTPVNGFLMINEKGRKNVTLSDVVTMEGGRFYTWVPNDTVITRVTCGGQTYEGIAYTYGTDVSATFGPIPGANGTAKTIQQISIWPGTFGDTTTQLYRYVFYGTGGDRAPGVNSESVYTGYEGDTVVAYVVLPQGYQVTGLNLLDYSGTNGNFSQSQAASISSGFTMLSPHCFTFKMRDTYQSALLINCEKASSSTGDFAVSDNTCVYSFDSSTGTLTFTGSGKATVSMKAGVSTTKNNIRFGPGANVDLTLNGVSIDIPDGLVEQSACITLDQKAGNCALVLQGNNTLKTTEDGGVCFPTIRVETGTSSLHIRGEGALTVTNDSTLPGSSPAIGYYPATSDVNAPAAADDVPWLVIESGTIQLNAKNSVIGTNDNYKRDSLIKGGTILTTGGQMDADIPWIAGAITGNKFKAPIVTGGSLRVVDTYPNWESGVSDAFKQKISIWNPPTSGHVELEGNEKLISSADADKKLYLCVINLQNNGSAVQKCRVKDVILVDAKGQSLSYGTEGMYTDEAGSLYLWVPEGSKVLGVVTDNGTEDDEYYCDKNGEFVTVKPAEEISKDSLHGSASNKATFSQCARDSLSNSDITFKAEDSDEYKESGAYKYTGTSIKPQIKVTWHNEALRRQENLIRDVDYTVSYGLNDAIGYNEGNLTITGIGRFSGSKTASFDILHLSPTLPVDGDKEAAPESAGDLTYTGLPQNLMEKGVDPVGGWYQYSYKSSNEDTYSEWSMELPQAKEAGTYDVRYRILGDGIHANTDAVETGQVTIGKAPLQVKVKDAEILFKDAAPYNESNAQSGLEITGFVNGETLQDLLDQGKISADLHFAYPKKASDSESGPQDGQSLYAAGSSVGSYWITLNYGTTSSTLQADNYAINLTNGTLTVQAQGVKYVVLHEKQQLDGSYSEDGVETDLLTGNAREDVTPEVKSYEGFDQPQPQTVELPSDDSGKISYRYPRKSYQVNVECGDGIESVTGEGTYLYGAQVDLTANLQEGYRSVSWSGDIQTDSFVMPAHDVNIKAEGNIRTYTVTFDSGNGDTIPVQNVAHGGTVEHPLVKPQKEGWTFLGWFTGQEEEVEKFDFDQTRITSDLTLYGHWTELNTDQEHVVAKTEEIVTVPDSIQNAHPDLDLSTPEKLTDYMIKKAVESFKTLQVSVEEVEQKKTYEVYDVQIKVKITTSDGREEEVALTKDNFPDAGIDAILPYPAGTDNTYTFEGVHMCEYDFGAYRAGDSERLAPEHTEAGLKVHLSGLSPVLLTWQKTEEIRPVGPDADSDGKSKDNDQAQAGQIRDLTRMAGSFDLVMDLMAEAGADTDGIGDQTRFVSSNPRIAIVTGLGKVARVTSLQSGRTTISVYGGGSRQHFVLIVTENPALASEEALAYEHDCKESDYHWDTVQGTETEDGTMTYKCTVCGKIRYRVPITAYFTFNKNTADKIRSAKAGDTVTVSTPVFVSFHEMVRDALVSNPGVTLVVNYKYNQTQYQMTIPGTATQADLDPLWSTSKYAGFRSMAPVFPTTSR